MEVGRGLVAERRPMSVQNGQKVGVPGFGISLDYVVLYSALYSVSAIAISAPQYLQTREYYIPYSWNHFAPAIIKS